MSTTTIRTRIKKRIAFLNPSIDVADGNVIPDLVCDCQAAEIDALDNTYAHIKSLVLLDASAFTDEEADAFAEAHNKSRIQATKATSQLVIGMLTAPSASSPLLFPAGMVVSTQNDSISFITTEDGTITSSTALNTTSGYYECRVAIQAQSAGSASNVGVGTLTKVVSAATTPDVVYNADSVTTGVDIETTVALVTRVKAGLAAVVRGSIPYYEDTALADSRVKAVVVVDPDNEYSIRGPGSIDIYVQGAEGASYTQTVTTMSQAVSLDKSPVILGSAVVTYDGGSYNEGNGFTIVKDTTSFVAGSTEAHDVLMWDAAVFDLIKGLPSYTISYHYNKLVEDLQDKFVQQEEHIIGARVLVKETEQQDVDIELGIVIKSGYDLATVKNAVISNIENYVNTLLLNTALRQSDIINIVENTDGVDYLREYGSAMFYRFCLVGNATVGDLVGQPLVHYHADSSNIVVG